MTLGSDRLLDGDVDASPEGMEVIRAALEWHFNPETGSPFWVSRARTLGFDPRRDIQTFDDLGMFPNIVDELREVPVRDLVPRGYGEQALVAGVFDSGGDRCAQEGRTSQRLGAQVLDMGR